MGKVENEKSRLFSLSYSLKKGQKIIKKYTKDQNLLEKLAQMRQEELLKEYPNE